MYNKIKDTWKLILNHSPVCSRISGFTNIKKFKRTGDGKLIIFSYYFHDHKKFIIEAKNHEPNQCQAKFNKLTNAFSTPALYTLKLRWHWINHSVVDSHSRVRIDVGGGAHIQPKTCETAMCRWDSSRHISHPSLLSSDAFAEALVCSPARFLQQKPGRFELQIYDGCAKGVGWLRRCD